MRRLITTILLLLLAGTFAAQAQDAQPTATIGPTLTSILSRREIICGVNQSVFGFGYLDPNTGEVRGFDVEFCRALATALFGDPAAAQIPIYPDLQRAKDDLASGQVDILFRSLVLNAADDAAGFEFGPPNFYNGQTLMFRSDSAVTDWEGLDGATICVTPGSTAQNTLPYAASSRGASVQLLEQPSADAAMEALTNGQCDAQSGDMVLLTGLQQRADDPGAYRVWQQPDQIYTREPFAPLLRAGDDQWSNIVRWTLLGLIQAEQLGISSENINSLLRQSDGQTTEDDATYRSRVGPDVARFLDRSLGIGGQLNLEPDFMQAVIRAVGNYGEIYERYLGANADLPIERGLNNLWQNGGLLFAPDWR